MPSVPFALLSGAFGATAACLAKFAFSPDTFLTQWVLQTCDPHYLAVEHCQILAMMVRVLCFIGTLVLNIVMVGSFLEGMEESGSVAGTAMSSAANFVVSSVLGFMLWDEDFSTTWLFGFSLVVLGTLLLSTIKAESTASTTSNPTNSDSDTEGRKKKD